METLEDCNRGMEQNKPDILRNALLSWKARCNIKVKE